jgi:hypothetical protein
MEHKYRRGGAFAARLLNDLECNNVICNSVSVMQ